MPTPEANVSLTAAELLLLRQRLAFAGPGTPAIDSALDAKLYRAQKTLSGDPSEVEKLRELTRAGMENPGRTAMIGADGDVTLREPMGDL
jgi:hypothetical protein